MKGIVTLINRQGHKSDRSWNCSSTDEAQRMVQWLKENNIEARNMGVEQWSELPGRGVEMTTISKHSVITINTKDKEYEYDMAFISCEGLSYEGLEVFVKHNHPDWTSFVLVVVNQG